MLKFSKDALKSVFFLPWHKLARIRYATSTKLAQISLLIVPIYVAGSVFLHGRGVEIPLPVSFILLYVIGLLFFVSCVIFDMFCPNIVRNNKSFPVYYKDTQLLSLEIISKYMDISKRKNRALDKALSEAMEKNSLKSEKKMEDYLSAWLEETNKLDNLWHTRDQWVKENHKSKPVARFSCTLLFYSGLLLALWLTLYDAPSRLLHNLAQLI